MNLSKRLIFITLLMVFGMKQVRADETSDARQSLKSMSRWCEQIKPHVEASEKGRLLVIQKAIAEVDGLIESNGLASLKTIRGYEFMLITLRHSFSFFESIKTPHTSTFIAKIVEENEAIAKRIDFDENGTPATRITATVFSQMHKLLLQAFALSDLPSDLRTECQALIPNIGQVIATAKQGDRPKTYDAAIPLQEKIRSLYGVFETVSHSHAAFNLFLEIRGLNEWYGEFAQVDEK